MHPIREGDAAPCSHCDRIGRVTAIHGANIIACCDTCAAEWHATFPDEARLCAKCGRDDWECAAHHGDAHYNA